MGSYDVVIVGGGPAGAACALGLGGSGLKVAVLEKSRFPRDKVCGDAIPNTVPKVLRSISDDLADAFGRFGAKNRITGFRLIAPNLSSCTFSYSRPGYTSARMDFDHFLFEEACRRTDADFVEAAVVKEIERVDGGVRLETADGSVYAAEMVVGCDGAHSVVARAFTDNGVDKDHYCGAVRAYYRGVAETPNDLFEIFLPRGFLPGYFWVFPLPDGLVNVGFGMLSSAISERHISLRQSIDDIIEAVPELADRFRRAERIGKVVGFGLPMGSRKVAVSGERFLLAGDAASLIDPMTGEGIGNAVLSGKLAADQVRRSFAAGDFSAAAVAAYDDALYGRLWKELRIKALVQRALQNRTWMVNLAIARAARHQSVRKLIQRSL